MTLAVGAIPFAREYPQKHRYRRIGEVERGIRPRRSIAGQKYSIGRAMRLLRGLTVKSANAEAGSSARSPLESTRDHAMSSLYSRWM